MALGVGFKPTTDRLVICRSVLAELPEPKKLPQVGFEPTCLAGGGFKDRCVYRFRHWGALLFASALVPSAR